MKLLHVIFANLRTHWVRTTLTILSIAVAFILFGFLAAIRKSFEMGVDIAGVDRLVVRHSVTLTLPLPASYEREIEQIDGVSEATPFTWFNGIYQDARNFFPSIATDPAEFATIYPEYAIDDAARERWLATRTGAVVGKLTADKYGFEVGDRVPLQATIWQPKDGSGMWEFEVVGIYEPSSEGADATNFFFRQDYLEENNALAQGLVGWYVIKIADPNQAEEIASKIDAKFKNSQYSTKTENEKAFVQGFAKQVGNIGAIAIAITSFAFLTILLVAGNTMAQAVRERTSELGVLKALGFTNRQILMYVITESLVIGGIGGGLGLLAGWLLVARGDPTRVAFPVFYYPTTDLLLGIVLVVVLSVAAGLVPAIQAMRLDPVEALRR